MNDIIDNETGEFLPTEPMEISGAVAAEISQQVATAKRYPRRADKAISTEIMSRATLDEETASECVYSLPRAGKDIIGPSVRFAEIVFASFGNMRAGARFVELDTKDPSRAAVIIEGVCIDMQMNNGQTVPVRRSIVGKKGMFNADMTNIAFSAGAAIARREAILKTVPKSIWGAAWKQVLAVLQGDQKTLGARRKQSIETFQKMGVDPAKVFEVLGVAGEEAITLEHMPRLIGMWTALRDGTETIEGLFGRGGSTHETVHNPLKDDPKAASGDSQTDSGIKSGTKTPETKGNSTGDSGKTAVSDPVESGGKPDPITSGPQGAQERSEPEATEGQPAKETAQAAAAGPAKAKPEKPYADAAGYIDFIQAGLREATGPASVTDLWGSTRADRNALLSPDQIDDLTDQKAARLKALKPEGKT